jgi:hypothetical protein
LICRKWSYRKALGTGMSKDKNSYSILVQMQLIFA